MSWLVYHYNTSLLQISSFQKVIYALSPFFVASVCSLDWRQVVRCGTVMAISLAVTALGFASPFRNGPRSFVLVEGYGLSFSARTRRKDNCYLRTFVFTRFAVMQNARKNNYYIL